MKGISPMIAVVLLIAFTVAIGIIISIFFSTFTRTQTSIAGGDVEDRMKCLNSILSVAGKWASSETVNVRVGYDLGTINLINTTVYVKCGNTIVSQAVTTGSFVPGSATSVQVSNTACTSKDSIDLIRVMANCTGPSTRNVYAVIAECKKETGCIS